MVVLTPLLAAIYLVLALAAASGDESRLLTDLQWPLTISLGLALLATVSARRLTGDSSKASILATLVVVSFGVFGYVVQEVAVFWQLDGRVVAPWVFLAMDVVLITIALQLRKTRRGFQGLARYLLIMMCLLTGYAGARVGLQVFRGQGPPIAVAAPTTLASPLTSRPPDVYLVILDKYGGPRELRDQFGLDNDPFEADLRQRGFYVPDLARANYVHTFLSLASMLNYDYLGELGVAMDPSEANRQPLDPLVEQNRLVKLFRMKGYRVIFFPSSYPATRRNRLAHVQIPAPEHTRPEFLAGWLRTTPILMLGEYICPIAGCVINPIRYAPEAAAFIDWKLARLEGLAGSEQPVFAFMHLVLPHEPYIYDAHCRHRIPYWPVTDDGPEFDSVKAAYTDQIRCLNRKLTHLVSVLQARSITPPIILLQSDHGHGRMGRHVPSFDLATADQREGRASVFAAYALPGVPSEAVAQATTPVNVIRLALREYFGEALPPLKDVTYWSSTDRPYDFVCMRVSDARSKGSCGEREAETMHRGFSAGE